MATTQRNPGDPHQGIMIAREQLFVVFGCELAPRFAYFRHYPNENRVSSAFPFENGRFLGFAGKVARKWWPTAAGDGGVAGRRRGTPPATTVVAMPRVRPTYSTKQA